MARSEGGFRAGFRDKCRTPKGSEGFPKGFRLASGTRGLLRKVPKGVPAKASKGHSVGLRDGSERVSGHAAHSEGLRKGVLRGGTSRRGLRKDFREGLRKVPERVFRTDFRRASGRVSERVFEGGWASG